MFDLSIEDQKKARASKPRENLDELSTNLGMDELVELTTLVEIQNAIRKTFREWARKVNHDGDGEKIYAYNAMRILQKVSRTWARLHEMVASSRDKELGTFSSLRQQLAKLEKIHDRQQTKLQGELLHIRGQSRMLQDEIAKRGMSIVGLEQKLAALSLQPVKNVSKKAQNTFLLTAIIKGL